VGPLLASELAVALVLAPPSQYGGAKCLGPNAASKNYRSHLIHGSLTDAFEKNIEHLFSGETVGWTR
jgi:hypothetical protein